MNGLSDTLCQIFSMSFSGYMQRILWLKCWRNSHVRSTLSSCTLRDNICLISLMHLSGKEQNKLGKYVLLPLKETGLLPGQNCMFQFCLRSTSKVWEIGRGTFLAIDIWIGWGCEFSLSEMFQTPCQIWGTAYVNIVVFRFNNKHYGSRNSRAFPGEDLVTPWDDLNLICLFFPSLQLLLLCRIEMKAVPVSRIAPNWDRSIWFWDILKLLTDSL